MSAARAAFRLALFQRRGLSASEAQQAVERLTARDAERDDRRMCVECAHIQRQHTCWIASQGRMKWADRRFTCIPTLLWRCEFFKWQMPA